MSACCRMIGGVEVLGQTVKTVFDMFDGHWRIFLLILDIKFKHEDNICLLSGWDLLEVSNMADWCTELLKGVVECIC